MANILFTPKERFIMKRFVQVFAFALVATFSFSACETKKTENAVENTGEAVESDVEATGDSLNANTDQAVDATQDAAGEAGAEVEAETKD
ncbi:MAG: hypothetical protein AVDCRST_MAG95-649 [uncultured Adhaeribacter sp.]|uniref:Entericidin EcnAB n=1 Tax=uncultured Adhaeribacter sp. TaxID=448109 RepID=A0A6J4HFV2_9BACT|nr:MAG: hypothetical protein AVDCRST_MAG95-649 [uncultured Adhaeribacter sp.]